MLQPSINDFTALLNRAVALLNHKAAITPGFLANASASEVEKEVCEALMTACVPPFSPSDIMLVSGARFPDIVVAGLYGVEVKSTIKDHWTSTGSSIVESTRQPGVERIAMLFAKLGGFVKEFRWRPYEDVLKDIAVTHCPRYLIDMELPQDKSIFKKIGTDYDTFRKSGNSIALVRDYYRDKAHSMGRTEMPWWLGDPQADVATSVTVTLWRNLPLHEKYNLRAMMLILFPEVANEKFDNAALWLVTTRSVLNPHIRDVFSAGGKVQELGGFQLLTPMPKIYKTITDSLPTICQLLADREFVNGSDIAAFNPELASAPNPLYAWINQITCYTQSQQLEQILFTLASKL